MKINIKYGMLIWKSEKSEYKVLKDGKIKLYSVL